MHYETYGSSGGRGIPAWETSKAPYGDWAYDKDGITQLKVPDKTVVIPIGHTNDKGYGDVELPGGRDVWIELSHVHQVEDTPPAPVVKKYKVTVFGITATVSVEELL